MEADVSFWGPGLAPASVRVGVVSATRPRVQLPLGPIVIRSILHLCLLLFLP